jgi:DNA invertase Pin-like site-specific DNA recombinase
LIHFFNEKNIAFKSLQESIDTSTSSGKLFLHIFGALAEFERELIRERTIAGLRAASLRGRKGGRPRLMDDNKIQQAKALHQSQIPIMEICRTLAVSKGTLYRSLETKSNI